MIRSPVRFLLGCAGASLLAGGALTAAAAPAAPKAPPNVIFVLVDDMGWADFSCFGNREVATQNIDRLAAEGLRFEHFYVGSPICSPSRTAVSTGQYPQRWRITSFLNNRANNEERGMAQWLDPQAPMLARQLHDAGYATGHFGKWHLGGQRDVGEAPLITAYGFEASLTNFEGLGPRVLPLCDAYDGKGPQKHALGSDNLGHGPIMWDDRAKITSRYVGAALAFIRQAQAQHRPFYINVWPDDVHSPFFPAKERRGDGKKHTLYLSVLDAMDEQLGVLFDAIRGDPALRDNTIIVICSDNGPEGGAGSAGALRGGKGMLYEGGIRSPLVVWGPGWIAPGKAGSVNRSSFLASMDLVPTLLALAGVPAERRLPSDGVALPDVLLGRSEASRGQPLFFRRPPDRDRSPAFGELPSLAVREGAWKLLCDYQGGHPQLYDVVADPGESNNLAAREPAVVRRLTEKVLAWHRSMPADNGATYRADGPGRKKRKKQEESS